MTKHNVKNSPKKTVRSLTMTRLYFSFFTLFFLCAVALLGNTMSGQWSSSYIWGSHDADYLAKDSLKTTWNDSWKWGSTDSSYIHESKPTYGESL